MYWWFVYSMFFNSGDDAASFLELLELEHFLSSLFCLVLILQHQFLAYLRNILLWTRLRMSDFWIWVGWAPVAWLLSRLLFFHRHTPDWPEIPNFVKRFPHSFAHARATPDMASLSLLESLHSNPSSGFFSTRCFAFTELVFGVNIFNLDFGFQMEAVEQPVMSNSVGSGHVSSSDFVL